MPSTFNVGFWPQLYWVFSGKLQEPNLSVGTTPDVYLLELNVHNLWMRSEANLSLLFAFLIVFVLLTKEKKMIGKVNCSIFKTQLILIQIAESAFGFLNDGMVWFRVWISHVKVSRWYIVFYYLKRMGACQLIRNFFVVSFEIHILSCFSISLRTRKW